MFQWQSSPRIFYCCNPHHYLQPYSQSRRPGVLLVGTTPRGHSSRWVHSWLMRVSGIVPGKIMVEPGTMRPAALWIALLQRYSQNCWILSYQPFPKNCRQECPQTPFLPVAPIDSQWILFCSTGIVPVEIMEWPGTDGQLPTGVHQPIILPKTAWKWKNLDQQRVRPWYPLDPPLTNVNKQKVERQVCIQIDFTFKETDNIWLY